ncbi:hypothetical protein ACVWXO_001880 [Bradyrhizobium sp. LM2.7]
MAILSKTVGSLASALVLITFTMKDMPMLRIIAVFSNIAFIAYGILDWLVIGLHLLLLPLNLLRLKELQTMLGAQAISERKFIGPTTLRL